MTYCVAISVDSGIVFCSDSRTNAGIDQVSTYSKMYAFGHSGERQFVILNAGNLATTQAVISQLRKDIKVQAESNLMTTQTMRDTADYIGSISVAVQSKHETDSSDYEASFILGGQIGQGKPKVFLIYPQGNYITTSTDTPFLQIGESKYGKPILDRIITPKTTLSTAASCALVSMDSTMNSNLTVGPPIEVTVYKTNTLEAGLYHRFNEDSEYLRNLKSAWDSKLKEAFSQLPPMEWAKKWDQLPNEQNLTS